MKKIMFHIHTLTKGGAERAVVNLAKELSDSGNDVTIVTSIKCDSEYEVPTGVKRIILTTEDKLGNRFNRMFLLGLKLRKIVKTEKPDVVIAFISGSIVRAVVATVYTPTKVIASVRNDPNYEYAGKVGSFIGKKILPLVNGCVFQTEDAKAWFPTKLQNKSIVIKNAINPLFFTAKRDPVKYRIVTFGRLAHQKNQGLLIDAFCAVSKEIEDAELFIFGKGECYQALSSKITELNLNNKVHLMGETSKVLEELEKADIFVLSSDFEGMPNALMEAMAAGVPCISTDCPCGGPKSLIKNGTNGILVPVGDALAMEDAIKKLLLDNSLKNQISNNAFSASLDLTPQNIAEKWLEYIGTVIND